MRYSFRLPNADYLGFPASAEAIAESAVYADELGFDAVVVNDHVAVDDSPRSVPWRTVYDPLMILSYVAARTSRVMLGTSVLILPYRNPIVTAKMIATLDQMSDGRAIAGAGAGWSESEYAALGVPYRQRGARADECLRLWQACWAPGPTTFHGQFHSFDNMHINPKPVQQPHPPIWIGGSGPASLRRAAQFAEVWQPTPTPIAELIANQSYLREACAQLGRATPPRTRMSFRVNLSPITGSDTGPHRPPGQGTPTQVASDLKRYRQEANLEEFQINFSGCANLEQLLDSMDLLFEEVIPQAES